MPRDQLEKIIKDFKIDDFTQFFRLKTQAQGNFRLSNEKLSQYNDSDLSGLIKLGQIEFSTTEKLVVISVEAKKDLSERSGKKNQYEKAKKILKELAVYSAGIFIFYDTSGNFRFSLIYPEVVGSRREWSSFRRFTYFVSKEFTNKTFLSRIGEGDFSTLAKIKEAFSVEKVTKEFYLEYRKLFESLLGELSKNHTFKNEASRNGLNPENFAKKLLGQIVFLYFVQKKGWLGVPSGGKWGEGNKKFMSDLFREAIKKNTNFYNDYLEKLFYNILNNPRRNSVDPSFSKDFNCRIPFLNGGLFEAEYDWKNSLICLDNNIFKAIFDVFERYNFTIEEESPDDKEVAVDPEMLGKVFENLLPENLRKGKGTYYTPREIVYYMCRESLVNYLVSNHSNITEENVRNYIFYSESFENFKKQKGESFTPGQWKELDDLLKSIKVCDPACGSGAFLVGMLNLIMKLRMYLQTTPDSYLIPQKTEYEFKKETIQNCIYGVDIDPGAIEIAKLRLWLSLVVDYNVEDIEPLPNLDYRLMCGNSLLEEYEGVKFYNGEENGQQATLLVDTGKQEKIVELEKKVKDYFDIHDDKEKQAKRKEINDIKDWLVRSALEKRKKDLATQRKNEEAKANMLDQKSREKYLASWGDKFLAEAKIKEVLDNLHNPKAAKPFFVWKLEFIDVFEDKKGFDVVIANPPYIRIFKQDQDNNTKEAVKKVYKSAYKDFDYYVLFIEKGLNILKLNGVLTYITPDKYLVREYGTKIRELIFNYSIKELFDLSRATDIFDAATYPLISIIQKNNQLTKIKVKIARTIQNLEHNYKEISLSKQLCINNDRIEIIDPELNVLIEKVFSQAKKLSEVLNPSQIFCGTPRAKDYHLWSKYISEKHTKGCLKVLVCSNLSPYIINYGKKVRVTGLSISSPYFGNKNKIISKTRWQNFLFIPKILIRGNDTRITAALDEEGSVFIGIYGIIIEKNIIQDSKTLLACLNSNLYQWIFAIQNPSIKIGGEFFSINSPHILRLPFKKPTIKQREGFNKVVDKIMAITKASDYLENPAKKEEVKEYEKQIDQMVYKLYGFTTEEIKIVEEK